jgi:glucose uptake protein
MFTPQSFAVALAMMVTSTICWGSWANTYKGVKNYRFELFYWDYAVGIFLASLILALTMGSLGHDGTSFVANAHSADSENIGYALLGGVIFNLANLLLVAGIEMAGLAVAFPVAIGIALVVGVVLSYVLQPKGSAPLLAAVWLAPSSRWSSTARHTAAWPARAASPRARASSRAWSREC